MEPPTAVRRVLLSGSASGLPKAQDHYFTAWSSPRWTGNLPLFTLHEFRDLLCFPITFQTTLPSAPALGASRTSKRSPGLTDSGR